MDHDKLRVVATDLEAFARSMETVKNHMKKDPLTKGMLGGHPDTVAAIDALNGAIERLSVSTGHAEKFLRDASTKVRQSADSTKATDVNNSWGLKKAGGR
ncbi:hypothetical protein EV193_106360 [Herbihabitans rhizosphaerae]|uniref:Excreted virulence factor EspC (Type VII ESX diderm) n=1 Tax=Herbihabitans rhizosphaerae TaxID=1872711 RepID=A0A4Q7KPD0_9PSEU|nr:hypothetical protein [Herbihabitans rhizosphaerae]RZS37122.1 hypothetical protein EV193_106360 [Herbihabitans rhizosphaerae]